MSCHFCINATGDNAMISAVVHRDCEHCGYAAGLGPFVHVKGSDTPMITGRELETAPVGLYVMQATPGVPYTLKTERTYRFETDEFVDGEQTLVLMARVREDDGRPMPKGVVDAWIRKDGKQVIKAYQAPPQD